MPYLIDCTRSTKLASAPVATRVSWNRRMLGMDMTFDSMWKWSKSYRSNEAPWRTYKLLRSSSVSVPSAIWGAPYGYGVFLTLPERPGWSHMEAVDQDALEREVSALTLTSARVAEVAARAEQVGSASDPSTAGIVASQQGAVAAMEEQLEARRSRVVEFFNRLAVVSSDAPLRWTALDVGALEQYVVANELLISEAQAELSLAAARREIEMGEVPLPHKALRG